MAIGTRLSVSFNVSPCKIPSLLWILRISYYATASTDSAAYIIGGYLRTESVSTIAEYKNNIWRNIGDLKEPKSSMSSILYNGEYILVGGYVDSSSNRWAFSYKLNIDLDIISGPQLKFGIWKQHLLGQPTHLNITNIGSLFCYLSTPIFALESELFDRSQSYCFK